MRNHITLALAALVTLTLLGLTGARSCGAGGGGSTGIATRSVARGPLADAARSEPSADPAGPAAPPVAPDGPLRRSAATHDPPAERVPDRDVQDRSTAPVQAVLHQHATHDEAFPGQSFAVGPGFANAGRAFIDDEISSVDVPAGHVLILYRERDERGDRLELAAGHHNLAPYGFNDCASSLRLRRGTPAPRRPEAATPGLVVLFENRRRDGSPRGVQWQLSLEGGRATALFSAADRDFDNDAPSSISIPPGFEVTLFDEPDGRGPAVVVGPGEFDLDTLGFDDRTSSVRIRRMGDDG